MNRANPIGLLSVAVVSIVVMGGLGLWKGGLYIDWYEGDVLHLIEIVMRIVDGQRPHIDFMTPVGILSVWPIAAWVEAGLGIGMAIHAAQITLAVLLTGPIVRAAHSRFSGIYAYFFVVLMMVMALALVHGGTVANVSLSMHYNRWAWAFSLVALTLAALAPSGPERPRLDGALIGVLLGIVVLMKVTYIVALAPAVIAGLLLRGSGRTLIVAVIAGVATLGLATLILGVEFWPAYVNDLLTTARSEVRSFPGMPLDELLTAPTMLGLHLLALLAVILLRQGRRQGPGLFLLILLPGLVYITFQNFGNDPQWVLWLGLVLIMWRPDAGLKNGWGWELRPAVTLTAVALMALGSASFFNLAFSPFRHASVDVAKYTPYFPRSKRHDNLFAPTDRRETLTLQIDSAGRYPQFATVASATAEKPTPPTILLGETLETCMVQGGLIAWFDQTARALEAAGYADGTQIMVADLLSNMPLFSDGAEWVQGGAPWRYDGLPGIEAADYVLVPKCAVIPKVREDIVTKMAENDVPLHEVLRNDMFILLETGNRDQAIASNR